MLSGKNQLIGVRRGVQFTGGLPGATSYIKFFLYAVKNFFFGLRHYREFDLIYCAESWYTLVGLSISLFTGKSCVRDCASVTSEWLKRVKPPLFTRLMILTIEKIVRRFTRMNIALSEADRKAYIKQGFNPDKVVNIPRPADLSLADKAAGDREVLRKKLRLEVGKKILIYSGKRDYSPNMEAAEWIIRELAPALEKRVDNTQILMTGGGKKPIHTHPIVAFTSFIPNLFEYIHASDIFIAPIEMPSGRLTKVFDSLSCGTPTVVLASATSGISELIDGDNAMIAKDRKEFIEKTIILLEHPEKAHEIGLRGRKMLEEHYNWQTWEEKLNQVLESIIQI
jgi:glycosyltransferase involved in cell wall biosynthesis